MHSFFQTSVKATQRWAARRTSGSQAALADDSFGAGVEGGELDLAARLAHDALERQEGFAPWRDIRHVHLSNPTIQARQSMFRLMQLTIWIRFMSACTYLISQQDEAILLTDTHNRLHLALA